MKVDISNIVLTTARLKLRSFNKDDLLDFFEYASVEGVGEMAGWTHHKTLEDTKNVLNCFIADKNVFAIVDLKLNKVIGSIGLHKIEQEVKQIDNLIGLEIGYVLSKDYWNQGLMTEACKKVLEYVLSLNVDYVTVSHFDYNIQSKRVIEKLGFNFYKDFNYKDIIAKMYVIYNQNKEIKMEICCGNYQDAYNAYKGGAKRIELNSSLFLGGLTPSEGVVELIKENTDLEIAAMIRPRGAGFCYNEIEKEEMYRSAKKLLDLGVDGIVFGFLDNDGNIDFIETKKMIDLAHSYNKLAIFHRAIDVVDDYFASLEKLADLGIDRILTSGQANDASKGVDKLKKAYSLIGNKVEIVVGSKVSEENIPFIAKTTGIYAFHSSAKMLDLDPTTSRANLEVNYRYYADNSYELTSSERVKEFIKVCNNIIRLI